MSYRYVSFRSFIFLVVVTIEERTFCGFSFFVVFDAITYGGYAGRYGLIYVDICVLNACQVGLHLVFVVGIVVCIFLSFLRFLDILRRAISCVCKFVCFALLFSLFSVLAFFYD